MQIRATVIKLLLHYLPHELLTHIANELIVQSDHFETVGAPRRAKYAKAQAVALRKAAQDLDAIPY